MNEEEIKQRILAMKDCDKNGFILGLVGILHRDPEAGLLDRNKQWDGDTIEIVHQSLFDNGILTDSD